MNAVDIVIRAEDWDRDGDLCHAPALVRDLAAAVSEGRAVDMSAAHSIDLAKLALAAGNVTAADASLNGLADVLRAPSLAEAKERAARKLGVRP